MAAQLAEAQIRVKGDTAVIDLSGDINAAAEPVLTDAYDRVSAAGCNKVVLNFAGTEFINSTGIAMVVGLLAKARQDRRSVSACGLTDHYRHIFEITRLADFMPIYEDEGAARRGASDGS